MKDELFPLDKVLFSRSTINEKTVDVVSMITTIVFFL